MCPLVGSPAPSCGRQLWGLPSRMKYLSPQGVLLPQVYGTTASTLWLELRGPAAWQATPSWAVCRHACHQLLPWLRATFAMVPDAAWPGSDQRPWSTAPATGLVGWLGCPSASDPGGVGRGVLSICCPRGACSPVCALCAVRVWCWWLCPSSSPPNVLFRVFFFCSVFVLFCRASLSLSLFFFEKNGKGGARTLQAQAWATGAAVQ